MVINTGLGKFHSSNCWCRVEVSMSINFLKNEEKLFELTCWTISDQQQTLVKWNLFEMDQERYKATSCLASKECSDD